MWIPKLEEIRKLRRGANLTQRELAKLTNLSQSLIAKIETGKTKVSYETAMRIFNVLAREIEKKEKKAIDVMTKDVVYVRPEDSVRVAVQKMKENDYSQLPVVAGQRQIGSISEGIIMEKLEEMGEKVYKMTVSGIMGPPFPSVEKDIPVSTLRDILKHYDAVVVVENSKIIGIITKTDVI